MLDIKNKLDRRFKVITPEITTQKAFELLAERNVSILIFLDSDPDKFYFIAEREINKSMREMIDISRKPVKDIAIESFIFNYDVYSKEGLKYLIQFKKRFSSLGISAPDKFLVIHNKKPIGLVSDLEFTDVPDAETQEFKSQLDEFIDANDNPRKNLNMFYSELLDQGFNINPDIESYIEKVLDNRLKERSENEENKSPVTDFELTSDQITGSKAKQMTEPAESTSTTGSKGLAVIYNPSHIGHRPSVSSPEMPERLIKIMDLLKRREQVFNDSCKLISDYGPASEEDILRVHDSNYVKFIKNYAARGGGFLGDSTYVTKSTHELALLAVGGAFRAAEEVLAGNAEFALGLIRPPGHHASRNKYGGYCIYNNAAILARYLQAKHGLNKILILDWDAHAANGTMDIFYDDPSVMLISLHQDPHNYYPKIGFISQMGKSKGIGYTINVEMPRGSGDEEYLMVFKELVIPLFEKFQPDFIIGCNGFDPHHSDQFTDLQLTGNGYYKFCQIFRKYMINKMVILMEGGYNPYMGELTHTIINGLLNKPNQFNDSHLSLIQKVISDEKINVVLTKKLKELKFNLVRYHVL